MHHVIALSDGVSPNHNDPADLTQKINAGRSYFLDKRISVFYTRCSVKIENTSVEGRNKPA